MARRLVALLALLLLLPSAAAAEESFLLHREGCGSLIGSGYRAMLRDAGVEDCVLHHEATLSASCAEGACVVSIVSAVWATSGHPGARSLSVTLLTDANEGPTTTATVCSAAGSERSLACSGAATAQRTVEPGGCFIVVVLTAYREQVLQAGATDEARWRVCADEDGATLVRYA